MSEIGVYQGRFRRERLGDLGLGVRFGDEERSIGGGPAPAGGGDSTSGRDRDEIPKKAPPAAT